MMKPFNSILNTLVICFLFIAATSDEGIHLIHADQTIGRMQNEQKLSIFTGHVHFRQDTIHMHCDTAVFNRTLNHLDFRGRVYVFDGRNRIRARTIQYDPDKRSIRCVDSVRIKTDTDSMYAELMYYDLEIDSVFARRNVYLMNTEHQVQVWGDSGIHHDQKNYSYVLGRRSRLIKIDTSAADTLDIRAARLHYFAGDSARATAVDSVIIYKGALKAAGDTAIYDTDEEIVWLLNHPKAWYEENALSGNRIKALFDSLQITDLVVFGRAEARSRVDSLSDEENILRGREIYFKIENKKPQRILAVQEASSIYYLRNEQNEDQGSNFSTADSILILFTKGEVDSIKIMGGAQGVYYPQNYKGDKAFEGQ
ncbi:MAG: hypothetical protein GF313_03410 [Caldithrix sp.]|nr:hypothetical protein [Caldithrix sp.]